MQDSVGKASRTAFFNLFNHASHTQHNDCTNVQTADLQMGRVNNI